ncbi:lipoprotein-anchoring transpeptidase ErfK/SrfK [Mycolicibacterium iranicum]|uniref:Lipoprotein-anchoring transpeptidase ErfK/SrfK n=1 Tax=Mycolicibacterium iranicum TaxID=912594 RepID=A0A839QHK8_MYCIR|nr:L,D-transpeptidase [Mycolicibacterium iranicum]MBB2992702.1 lipoprotein-anchoring transpeptidase ErfK/SrfK [Mycolicibacterium iranicum]
MLRPRRQHTRPRVGRRIAAVLGSAALLAGLTVAGPVPTGAAAIGAAVATVSPAPGQTVGVAHPVTVRFATPVTDRTAAQQAIAVVPEGADAPRAGSFTWLDDRSVQWQPAEFFPAHTPVTVSVGSFATGFQTGSSVVGVADLSDYSFTVSIDGVVAREMPASMGKAKYPTPIGQFTALEKQRNVTFDSRTIGIPLDDPEGYLIKGEYGVRVTWGGVYVHSAPWSVGSQGYANVSHGCINLSPDNAAWYFDTVQVGDPIVVQA